MGSSWQSLLMLLGGAARVGRSTDLVSLGALTSLVPREVLDGAVEAHGCRERRVPKLPAHVVVLVPQP